MTRNLFFITICSCLAITLGSCQVATPEPTTAPTTIPTATVAPTVPGPTYTPTIEPTIPPPTPEVPTATITPETIIEATSETPEATVTTAEPDPYITALDDTNCRTKPDAEANVVGFFTRGSISDVLAKDEHEIWVLIANPQLDGEKCWVWIGKSRVTGSLDQIRIIR